MKKDLTLEVIKYRIRFVRRIIKSENEYEILKNIKQHHRKEDNYY